MDVCCAAGAPVSLDYTPKGSELQQFGGVPCYVARPPAAARGALVCIYDIFGLTPQFKQVCDRLAAAGYVVVAPDVFRGQPWSLERFPPKPEHNFMGWLSGYDWQGKVQPDVDAVVAALRAEGVTALASVGWCWGASMAAHAAASGSGFKATGWLHPSLFGKEAALCAALGCPVAAFSTPGDPFETIKAAMDATPHGAACVYKRYDNMIHGYCGARGRFEDPEVAAAVGETIATLTTFLNSQL